MKTNSAIYYPSVTCEDKEFLKEALFLWDKLEFIVPAERLGFSDGIDDRQVSEALEIISEEIVPSDEAKQIAHEEIMDIIDSGGPDRLGFELDDSKDLHGIYPEKFMDSTWSELQNRNLICNGTGEFNQSYVLDNTLGLYMMSTLAASCAGEIKRIVTNKYDAYRTLYNSLSDPHAGMDENLNVPLLTIPMKGIDLSDVSFDHLLALRKNEDGLLKAMRQQYLSQVDQCNQEMEKADRFDHIQVLSKEFSIKMEDDLKELKCALKMNAATTLLSKEFGVVVLGLALNATAPGAGLLSAGALAKSLLNYKDKRRKLLREHAAAWLLTTKQSTLPLY